MRNHVVAVIVSCVACGESNEATQRVEAEPNALGIVTLEIQRSSQPHTTTIRGLDGNDVEIAGATLRTGEVMYTPDPDLSPAQPMNGRELVVWLGEERMPPFTLRGIDPFSGPEILGEPLVTFTRLDGVVRVLGDAGITFVRPPADRAYTGTTCNTDKMPSSKGGFGSCCQEDNSLMWAIKSPGSPLLWRGLGAACTGSYGPCGSYTYWTGPTGYTAHVFFPNSSSSCGRDAGNTNWEPEEWVGQREYPEAIATCPYNGCCEGMPIVGTECGCGDGVCEPSEDPCSCAQDCGGSCGSCGGYCNTTGDCTGPGADCSNHECLCTI